MVKSLDQKRRRPTLIKRKEMMLDREEISGGGSKTSQHGIIFQLKLLMLFLYRATELCESNKYSQFRLATEMPEAEKFDDVVFQYKTGDKWKFRLLQAKHQERINGKGMDQINEADLLSTNKRNFSLQKYFRSFVKIKQRTHEDSVYSVFTDSEIEDVILCTDTDFIGELKSKLVEQNIDEDDLLKVNKDKNGKWQKACMYKFDQNNVMLFKELAVIFEVTSDFYKLIEGIVEHILSENRIEKDFFKDYYYALTTVVFDIKKGERKDDFYLSFREDFVNGNHLVGNAKWFRDALIKDMRFRQEYKDKELKIPKNFGKNELPSNDSKLRELAKQLADFATEGKELSISDFEDCHVALAAHVINPKTEKFYGPSTLQKAKNALRLKDLVGQERARLKYMDKITDRELKSMTFKLSAHFGKSALPIDENELSELAQQLANYIKRNKKLTMKSVLGYHMILSEEIINVRTGKFRESFLSGKIKKGKNILDIDPSIKRFRRLLLDILVDDTDGTTIRDKRVKVSEGFEEEFHPEDNPHPQIENVQEFAKEMQELLHVDSRMSDQEKYIKINVREFYGKFKSDIDMLAGYVLVKKYGKIRFSSSFLHPEAKLKGNLHEFKEELKKVLKCELEAISAYEFDFVGTKFKTCEEGSLTRELPILPHVDDVKEFFSKLKFVVNYPNRKEIGELLVGEIQEKIRALSSKVFDAIYQTELHDWMADRMGAFYTQGKAKKLFSSIKRELLFWEFEGAVNTHFASVASDYEFREYSEVVEYLENKEQQVLNIKSQIIELSCIKILQTLRNLKQAKNRHNLVKYTWQFGSIFFNFKWLKNCFRDVLECFGDHKNGNLLVINCNSSGDVEIVQSLNDIASILESDAEKKVILLTNGDNSSARQFASKFASLYKELDDNAIGFRDLQPQSQRNILDEKVITFQGQEEKICLRDLVGIKIPNDASTEELNDVVSPESLNDIIKGKDVVIGSKPLRFSDSEAAYVKLYEDVPKDTLVKYLSKSSNDSILFMVSGISSISKTDIRDQLIQLLNIDVEGKEKQANAIKNKTGSFQEDSSDKNIIVTTEHNEENNLESFKQLCEKNSNEIIHWIEVTSERALWKQIYYPKFYLPRYFRKRICIRKDTKNLTKEDPFDIFLISDVNDEDELVSLLGIDEEGEKREIMGDINNGFIRIARSKAEAEEVFGSIIQKESNKAVHWIRVERTNDIQELLWYRSHGNLDKLRQCIEYDNHLLKEDELVTKVHSEEERVTIISDKPGMGKSSTLTKLSEKRQKSHWVMRIDLKDCTTSLVDLPDEQNSYSDDTVVTFLSQVEGSLNSDLAKNILKYNLQHKTSRPLLLLFDAFDEIQAKTQDKTSRLQRKVIQLLKFLKAKEHLIMCITTRPESEYSLENSLSVFATKMKEFGRSQGDKQGEQEIFLKKFWRVTLSLNMDQKDFNSKFKVFISALLNHEMLTSSETDFMGIALQVRMMAELFQKDFKTFLSSEISESSPKIELGSIAEIYERFIQLKYDIYFQKRKALDASLSDVEEEILREGFNKMHRKFAFFYLFFDDAIKFEKLKGKQRNILSAEEALCRVGLVTVFSSNKRFEFIHHTFAEYFMADLFVNLLGKKKSNLKKYNFACRFLNKHISGKSNVIIFRFLENMTQRSEDVKLEWNSLKAKLVS